MFDLAYQTIVVVIGITAILASFGVILCASPIYSALYLIGNMICLALLFLLYNAEFIAAVQIIVYAGAVMILFLFIIALLGAKKEEKTSSWEKPAAFAFVPVLFGELLMALTADAGRPALGQFTEELIASVGNAQAVGMELFSRHLIPFELASILLLAATVGVICLAKFPAKIGGRRTK